MTLFIRIFGIRNRFNFQFRPIKVMQPISATHSHSHCRRLRVDESKLDSIGCLMEKLININYDDAPNIIDDDWEPTTM